MDLKPFDFDTEDQADLDADIRLFEAMFASKMRFFDTLVARAQHDGAGEIRELRQEIIYEIAEFWYLMRMFSIDTSEKLRAFGEAHTVRLRELLENPDVQMRLGVAPQRITEAMFDTEEKLDRLMANTGANAIKLSQTDLGRFLVEYMSFETCRTGVKILSDAGYLRITKSPFGAMLVSSTGALEAIFATHIREFRMSIDGK